MHIAVRSAVLAALLTWSATASGAQSPRRVSYDVRSLDGSMVHVGMGAPITLVAVFATWCRTCRAEFPALDSLRRALAPHGVRVLALSVDAGDDDRVRRWAEARGAGLLVARDASGAVGRTFGTVGVPEHYLVDARGMVRWSGRGDIRAELGGLRAALRELR